MKSQVIELQDAASGATARILVSLGFNCFSWQPIVDAAPREALWAHPDFVDGAQRPSGSGIPLLFPFAGRIGGAKFSFGGREYALEPGDAFGNAIHGFVFNRRWRVVEQRADRVVGEFQAAVDDASILQRWPSDFLIRVAYELRGQQLVPEVHYENTGDGPLPCAFGTHAYFRLPIAEGASADDTIVRAPVGAYWEMSDMIPTGDKASNEEITQLASGLRLGERVFDTVFTDLSPDGDGKLRTLLTDRDSGRTLMQTFDSQFTQCVIYTPPHREAICLEPYTAVPDAFRLGDLGHATGMQILQPGEVVETTIVLEVG